jgi:hypothetical protein
MQGHASIGRVQHDTSRLQRRIDQLSVYEPEEPNAAKISVTTACRPSRHQQIRSVLDRTAQHQHHPATSGTRQAPR